MTTIERQTHKLDATDQILGRFATKIATLLRGRQKSSFVYHQDCGDAVIIANAKDIKVTGKKLTQKTYYRHSGYPGNLKEMKLETMLQKHPDRVITLAVRNMLPKNRLRQHWMKRLTYQNDSNG